MKNFIKNILALLEEKANKTRQQQQIMAHQQLVQQQLQQKYNILLQLQLELADVFSNWTPPQSLTPINYPSDLAISSKNNQSPYYILIWTKTTNNRMASIVLSKICDRLNSLLHIKYQRICGAMQSPMGSCTLIVNNLCILNGAHIVYIVDTGYEIELYIQI